MQHFSAQTRDNFALIHEQRLTWQTWDLRQGLINAPTHQVMYNVGCFHGACLSPPLPSEKPQSAIVWLGKNCLCRWGMAVCEEIGVNPCIGSM